MKRLVWLGAATAALGNVGSALESPMKSPQIAPARDGDIAILEELCAVRAKGTVAAYDLFIARHPNHPLAEKAKLERQKLIGRQVSPTQQ